jgi:hypothetical protein
MDNGWTTIRLWIDAHRQLDTPHGAAPGNQSLPGTRVHVTVRRRTSMRGYGTYVCRTVRIKKVSNSVFQIANEVKWGPLAATEDELRTMDTRNRVSKDFIPMQFNALARKT